MAAKGKSYRELMKLARSYEVDTNAIVLELAAKYCDQKKLIDDIRLKLEEDGLTVKKEYVKGRENICANPLVDAWTKHNDSASRTLDYLATAITKFGHQPKRETGKLQSILTETDE